MFCLFYVGEIKPQTIEYLNWVNSIVPVGLISDRQYKGLGVTVFENFDNSDVKKVFVELGFEVEQFLRTPYKLCDLKPYSFLIFSALGVDLSRGFGYFDLDLVISKNLLERISYNKTEKLFLTGTNDFDFGHFRYYSVRHESLVWIFKEFLSACVPLVNSRFNHIIDESTPIRKLNLSYEVEIVRGFDQNIYSLKFLNNHDNKVYFVVNYNEDLFIDSEYFDYFHMQKRGFNAAKSFKLSVTYSRLRHGVHLFKIVLKRLKNKVYHEKKVDWGNTRAI